MAVHGIKITGSLTNDLGSCVEACAIHLIPSHGLMFFGGKKEQKQNKTLSCLCT